jgi:hypothetical protein
MAYVQQHAVVNRMLLSNMVSMCWPVHQQHVLWCPVLCCADIAPPLNARGFYDTYRSWFLGLMQGLPKGRLLKYDPNTKETHAIAKVRMGWEANRQQLWDSWL